MCSGNLKFEVIECCLCSNSDISDFYDNLTPGQISLLSELYPLSEWKNNYSVCKYCPGDSEWDIIEQVFDDAGITLTYDNFYYAGKNQSIKNENPILLSNLNKLFDKIFVKIPNLHYHNIARRIITDYQIDEIDYDNAFDKLNDILALL